MCPNSVSIPVATTIARPLPPTRRALRLPRAPPSTRHWARVSSRSPTASAADPAASAAFLEAIRRQLPALRLLTDEIDRESYRRDETPYLAAALPIAVALPTETAEVSTLVRLAAEHRVPIVPRGAGTGLSGGANGSEGALTIAFTKMDRILEIDEENLTATCEPGVITLDLFNAVAKRGLFYPPDPGSQKISTLGGNVAENAGGLRGLKYGVTRDYVMALKCVLPDRSLVATGGKSVKDVAGYAFKDLLVGSEGTLGIITEITVKLIPPPRDKRTFLAYFDDISRAGAAVSAVIAAKIIPSTMEIMDQATINCVEDFVGIGLPRQMAALLLIEVDGHPATVAEEAQEVARLLAAAGASEVHRAESAEEAARLTAARRSALSALARVSPTTLLEDATVPRSRLAETFGEIARLAIKYRLTVGTFGHAGDGNLHPTVLCDERDGDEMARAHAFYNDLYEKVLAWGGTVSGEHGIGLAKKEYLARQIGAGGVAVMRRIKRAFDPQGRLNPGKIFD